MSGYGKQGHFANRPAHDPVIQASSGIMSLNGSADDPYLRVGPLVDYGTGAQAAFAIAAHFPTNPNRQRPAYRGKYAGCCHGDDFVACCECHAGRTH